MAMSRFFFPHVQTDVALMVKIVPLVMPVEARRIFFDGGRDVDLFDRKSFVKVKPTPSRFFIPT